MATIKPFRALRPNSFYADALLFPDTQNVHYFGVDENSLALRPLKEQLEAPARKRPETERGQELAYQEINKNLTMLKLMDRVRLDEKPGIYIYEIGYEAYRQTGIWALTTISDYTEGRIKIHEQTLKDSERRIANYRRNTGLEGSPVLLTYKPDNTINHLIAEACATEKPIIISNKKERHCIWKIEHETHINALVDALSKIDRSYLADGHHRMAATARQATEQGHDTFISSLYIASDQLRIIDYHRVVIPEAPIDPALLLKQLAGVCEVWPRSSGHVLKPSSRGIIGMCLYGQWYELLLKDVTALDVLALQERILTPLFGINDPRNDARLKCIGGSTAMEEIDALLEAEPNAVAFVLCPMTVEHLINAADNNQILPPKSTWIDPKVPYGLLMNQEDKQN